MLSRKAKRPQSLLVLGCEHGGGPVLPRVGEREGLQEILELILSS